MKFFLSIVILKVSILLFICKFLIEVGYINNLRYDFRNTVVKIESERGHGSGNIIDTNGDASLILTNRHVCYMTTLDYDLFLKIAQVTSELFLCSFDESKCDITKLKEKLKLLNSPQMALGKKFNITFRDKRVKPTIGEVYAIDDNVDLCLIKINKPMLTKLKRNKFDVESGTPVSMMSNPLDSINHMTSGYAGELRFELGNIYQHNTSIFYAGSSGSATVDEDGKLVGVNTLGTDIPTFGLMIPVSVVNEFLKGKMLTE
jgi:S1-C subfamily serine protease